MIERYTLPEMGAVWTDESRFRAWLDVELAVCDVHAEMGTIPEAAAREIRERALAAPVDRAFVERVDEIERVTRHDVIAFTTAVAERVGPASRFVHYGLTSSDVVDTANGLLLKRAGGLVADRLRSLAAVLERRAVEHKRTAMMGRTHGVHAEPTTFGLVLLVFYTEALRNLERVERATRGVAVGKISGAVGTFAHLDPEVEERVCARLGLAFAPVSTQVVQRDRYAEFVSALAVTCSTLEKIALEVRHLQRTEVREAQEPFGKGQKGSSAMPHKRNPVVSEQICGLARVVRGNVVPAIENNALWHERDISHSSVERVILPDSCVLTDYLLAKTEWLVDGLVVHPERMRENLESLRGVIYSGQVLLELTRKGVTREDAYAMVQPLAMRVWDEDRDFRDLVRADPAVGGHMSADEIDRVFDLDTQLRNVDRIFERALAGAENRL
jgi:adenylosuccinate lyase